MSPTLAAPGSRKKLFAASLDEGGISYLHHRPLGTPKAGRDANRAGRTDEFHRICMAYFNQPEAQLALLEAEDLASATAVLFSASAATRRNAIATS